MPINPQKERFIQADRGKEDVTSLLEGIRENNHAVLARAITLIESSNAKHRALASNLIDACIGLGKKSKVLGITGTPGVGKSTFIEAFGAHLIEKGNKIAVLAIDPSSSLTKGSILGDKTRMNELSRSKQAFVRPSPSSGSLGGVARATRETIFLLEAAEYDWVLIETVGVGQSETHMVSMVDFFLTLLQPNAGDELQGIKRGIIELSDLIVINKAEEHNRSLSLLSQQQYQSALHLFPPRKSGWSPEVLLCSSIEKTGIPEIEENILSFYRKTDLSGFLQQQRADQNLFWFEESIRFQLSELIEQKESLIRLRDELRLSIRQGEISPLGASRKLMDAVLNS
ncbi:MAG TPA: methylmalonyl Co-A mutase-associated GTPase MeaB [Flavobacteriales bacterium]|jgi:LAO/AO transport system kinase|nr:methylmalonyl Co-A mutase-associated GTPase MeaB [Flavobacteriales bacterium]